MRRVVRVSKKAGVSAKAKTLAKKIAGGMVEGLDYDTNFSRLSEMIEQELGIPIKKAGSLAAKEVARGIASEMRRYWG